MKKSRLISLIGILTLQMAIPFAFAQYSDDYRTHHDDDIKLLCNRESAYATGVSDARKGLSRKEDYGRMCAVDPEIYNTAYNTGYNFGLSNQSGIIVAEPSPNHPEVQDQLPSSYVQPFTRPPLVGAYGEVNPNMAVNAYDIAGQRQANGDSQAQTTPMAPYQTSRPTGDFARPDPVDGLNSLTVIRTNPRPKCIETVNGQACGFNCVNTMNNVRCAANPDQVCRSNVLGIIGCGYNCVATDQMVRCGQTPGDLCISDTNGNVFCGVNCRIQANGQAFCDLERYAPI